MKKLIAYIPMITCFWLGHIVSKLVTENDVLKIYPIYNNLMGWSVRLNDWGRLDYWFIEEQNKEQIKGD